MAVVSLSLGFTQRDYVPPLPGEPRILPSPLLKKAASSVKREKMERERSDRTPPTKRTRPTRTEASEEVAVEAPPLLAPGYNPRDEPTCLPDDVGKEGTSFKYAPTLSYKVHIRILASLSLQDVTPQFIFDTILNHGIPIVLRNTFDTWQGYNRDDFSVAWLKEHYGHKEMRPRNNISITDAPPIPLSEYLDLMKDPDAQRQKGLLYGKDLHAPAEWNKFVLDNLPPGFPWLKDGDLLGAEARPESVMTYVGYEGTRTPGHTDLCATVGHNVMLYGADDKSGATWYIAGTRDLDRVDKLWRTQGHSIHHDNFFMPSQLLRKAPFTILDQRQGDLVIIPPNAAHQVINRGQTIKIAWNRVPVYLVSDIIKKTLPIHVRHKKAEVYRIKLAVKYGLEKRIADIASGNRAASLLSDLPQLLETFQEILRGEWFSVFPLPHLQAYETLPEQDQNDRRTCDVCNADVFNRCFQLHLPAEVAALWRDEADGRGGGAMAMMGSGPPPATHAKENEVDVCFMCAKKVGRKLRDSAEPYSGHKLAVVLSQAFKWKSLVALLHNGYQAYGTLLKDTHMPPSEPYDKTLPIALSLSPEELLKLVATPSTQAWDAYLGLRAATCHVCRELQTRPKKGSSLLFIEYCSDCTQWLCGDHRPSRRETAVGCKGCGCDCNICRASISGPAPTAQGSSSVLVPQKPEIGVK